MYICMFTIEVYGFHIVVYEPHGTCAVHKDDDKLVDSQRTVWQRMRIKDLCTSR